MHGIPVSDCLSCGPLIFISKVSSAPLISQSGSFALPAVMGCTGVALLSQSTLTHNYNGHSASEPGDRGTSFCEIPQSIKQTTMTLRVYRLDHRLMAFIFVCPIVGEPALSSRTYKISSALIWPFGYVLMRRVP